VTLEDGRRLQAAAETSNVPLLVGHHRQHSPIVRKAREIVESGILGRLVAATGSAMFYKPEEYFEQGPWRRQPGGGPILINMIHEVGIFRALIGEITAVQAFASNRTRGFPVEDTVAINLQFANGALGSFILSDTAATAQSWEQTSRENPGYASQDGVDCYSIVGTDGSLGIPTLRLNSYRTGAERSWWKPFETKTFTLDRDDPLERQLAHFCAVIRGETEPEVTVHDGLRKQGRWFRPCERAPLYPLAQRRSCYFGGFAAERRFDRLPGLACCFR
jgi:predicted dehydrogenase